MTIFGLMLRPLQQLENHVTKTDKKIDELKAGQKELEVKFERKFEKMNEKLDRILVNQK